MIMTYFILCFSNIFSLHWWEKKNGRESRFFFFSFGYDSHWIFIGNKKKFIEKKKKLVNTKKEKTISHSVKWRNELYKIDVTTKSKFFRIRQAKINFKFQPYTFYSYNSFFSFFFFLKKRRKRRHLGQLHMKNTSLRVILAASGFQDETTSESGFVWRDNCRALSTWRHWYKRKGEK